MEKELESKVVNDIANTITVAEAQIIWYLRKSNDSKAVIKLSNALKHLYNNHCDGIIRIDAKYSFTPDEIGFLEIIKDFSEDKLKNLKEFMEKLLEEG